MMLTGGAVLFLVLVYAWVYTLLRASAPGDEYEQRINDEAQMKYLREWRAKHGR